MRLLSCRRISKNYSSGEASNGATKRNPIIEQWNQADKDIRLEFLYHIGRLFNVKLCTFLQEIGKCKKGDA